MESEIREIPSVFKRILDHEAQFDQLGKILSSKNFQSVLILARGTSDNAAHFLKLLIETQLGLPVGLTSASSVTIYNSVLKYENTLVIGISQSGQSTDLIEFAKASQKYGAFLVTLTNDPESPLSKLSDYNLNLHAGKELAVAATKSYAAQLLCSFILVQKWRFEKLNLTGIVEEANRLVSLENLTDKVITSVDRSKEIIVLGRGFSYPNAKEAALKLQETSKISVQSFSIADYMHGPISSLSKSSQLIILLPFGFNYDSISNEIEKIRKVQPKIHWIGVNKIATPDDIVITGAGYSDEILSSILDSIVIQRFALNFARKNGMDPDLPQGLTKVTITK